jgi:two-component system response regulator TctD
VKILIVEDDAILGDALHAHLGQAGLSPTLVHDGMQADHLLSTQQFDLLILDIGLPVFGGFEVLRRLRQRGDRIMVLILTARDELHDRIQGFELGADDYLSKPFDMAELLLRAKALYRRAYGAGRDELTVGRLRLDPFGRRVTVDEAPIELSARELEILETLVMREGRVVSKEDLMQRLYDADSTVSANAVEVFLHRIRRKITGSGVAIRTIRGLGYLLEPEHGAQAE